MSLRRAVAGLAGAWAMAWATPALAAQVTVTFSGTVLEADDPESITDGSVQPGTPVSGYLTFDRTTPPNALDAHSGTYDLTTPPAAMHVDAGSYSLSSLAGIQVLTSDWAPADEPYSDVFQALTVVDNPSGVVGANPQAGFGLVLADVNRTALGSPDLAAVPFLFSAWSTPDIAFRFVSDTGEFTTVIQVESLAPEPELLAFVALGLAALGAARTKRAR